MSQIKAINGPHPRTWDDYEHGCLATYRGGHHNAAELAIFQHGIRTVFNLLRNEFPPAETIRTLERDAARDQLEQKKVP